MIKQLIYIFIIAFILNVVWEHLHSVLYIHYKGNVITELILLRAALFDAAVITILSYPFLRLSVLKNKLWIMILVAVIFAVGLEIWALKTNRWEYHANMPIVPVVQTGLTPTVQLALLSYLAVNLSRRFTMRNRYHRGAF